MDHIQRRSLLTVASNPHAGMDYLSTIEGQAPSAHNDVLCTLRIRYVPDKLILLPGGLDTYLNALAGDDWPSPEALAVGVLKDFQNELVARWAQVRVHRGLDNFEHLTGQSVCVEDSQPGWRNDVLLGQLRRS